MWMNDAFVSAFMPVIKPAVIEKNLSIGRIAMRNEEIVSERY